MPNQSSVAHPYGLGASYDTAIAAGVEPFVYAKLPDYGGDGFCGCEPCPGQKDSCVDEDAVTGTTTCATGSMGPLCASCGDVNGTRYVW